MTLEPNSIHRGDCLDIMPSIPDESIDMILCDLPYGITACEWDKQIPLDPLWAEYRRILKKTGVIALTADNPFAAHLIISNEKMWRHEIVWDKVLGTNFLNLKNAPFKTHGLIEIFAHNGHFTYNPIMVKRTPASLIRSPAYKPGKIDHGKSGENHYKKINRKETILKENGMKHPISIVTFNLFTTGRYEYKHPTRKPVDLFEYLIRTYSNEGDLVLDNCAGIGTTGVAAYRSKRNYILIEKEKKYYDIAVRRLRETEAQRFLL